MAALIRSESMTNLPVEDVEDEDIRLTWRSKARKVASLSGSYIVKFDDILLHEKPEQDAGSAIPAEPLVVESQTFLLCGNWWSVLLYPFGCDEDGEYLAVRLQNKSEDQVNAYYAISIKKSMSSEDNNRLNFWVDPGKSKIEGTISLCHGYHISYRFLDWRANAGLLLSYLTISIAQY